MPGQNAEDARVAVGPHACSGRDGESQPAWIVNERCQVALRPGHHHPCGWCLPDLPVFGAYRLVVLNQAYEASVRREPGQDRLEVEVPVRDVEGEDSTGSEL